ncbi:MAG: HEAT repeat domain-containing protein, partial [Candidatus Aminicenantes bacterium]|nr:HEAT repeat domain-containing protein [Candidatus Aminicenantes bacterium]
MRKMSRLAAVGTAVFLILMSAPRHTSADEAQDKDAIAYKQAYNFILESKWAEALKAMEAVAKDFPKSAWFDDARFWQCYSREKLGQALESVFKCYQEFIDAYPKSEWADDARANMVRLSHELSKRGKPEYRAKIRALEENQETDVRLAALYALQEIGDPDSLKTLIDLYDTAKNTQLKSRILFMLQDFKSPEAAAKLKEIALNDPDPQARRYALIAMAQSRDPETIGLLMEIAKSGQDEEMRKAALVSLMDSRDSSVTSLLIDIALRESNAEIARIAVLGLQNAESP